jgi:peptidoglycan/LPS O-acetylase OafA/YrhL
MPELPAERSHPRQIPALTGLRFFAAAFILIEHSADWLARFTDSNVNRYFIFLGMYGMPLFFVLSGFVIHYNYRKLFLTRSTAQATCEFAAARFARLFPLYFFLLVIAIFADHLTNKTQGDYFLFGKIMAYYTTLTQSWWYVIYDKKLLIYWIFPLSWSISTEMYFYIAYVAVVFLILLMHRRGTAVLSALAYGIIVMCLFILSERYLLPTLSLAQDYIPNYIPPEGNFQNSFYFWLFYFSPYVRVFEFLMGCMTAHAFLLTKDQPVSSTEQRYANLVLCVALLTLAILGLLYLNVFDIARVNALGGLLYTYVNHLYLNFLCAPTIAFIMFYVARYDSWFTRMMSLPFLIVLGDTSYSIYLLHTWTLRPFLREPSPLDLASGLDAILRISLAIGLTLGTAYVTYRLIEVPSRTWLRRTLGGFISVVFQGMAPAGEIADKTVREITRGENRYTGGRARLAFSAGLLVLLASMAIIGEAAQSETLWLTLYQFRILTIP